MADRVGSATVLAVAVALSPAVARLAGTVAGLTPAKDSAQRGTVWLFGGRCARISDTGPP